jgi:hypothetical protein
MEGRHWQVTPGREATGRRPLLYFVVCEAIGFEPKHAVCMM